MAATARTRVYPGPGRVWQAAYGRARAARRLLGLGGEAGELGVALRLAQALERLGPVL